MATVLKYWDAATSTWKVFTGDVPAPTASIQVKGSVTGLVNGSNAVFNTGAAYVAGTLQVYVNGVAQSAFATETSPSAGTFTLDAAPNTGSDIKVYFHVANTGLGNADTVDNYHANAVPTANNLLPLNSSGKYPASVLPDMSFSAYNSNPSGTSIPTAVFTHIDFNAELFDTMGWFNTTTGRFTPQFAGKYLITSFVGLLGLADTATMHVAIRKNGANLHWTRGKQSGSGEFGLGVTSIVELNGTTDYVDIAAWISSGTTNVGGSLQNTWIQGTRI